MFLNIFNYPVYDAVTGEEFHDLEMAREVFCQKHDCVTCPMPNAIRKDLPTDSEDCWSFTCKHQTEAMSIIGVSRDLCQFENYDDYI